MVRQLKNNAARGVGEWRNVVLNFECREASRLNLESPYSLFINNKGHSYCSVNKQHYRIETDNFLFSQPGDIYGLTVDNMQKTELCNIHINKSFFNGVAHSLTTTHELLLDDPEKNRELNIHLFSQLFPKDETLNALTARLTASETYSNHAFESVLMELVAYLLRQNEDIKKSISRLPFAKPSVQTDIYRRLAVAKDYICSNYNLPLALDEICRETGMSKFHFLRVFKSFTGITPYQYLSDVRMNKARQLLKNSNNSISEIASDLGYEYPNSFIKAFQKNYQIAPMQYRKQVSPVSKTAILDNSGNQALGNFAQNLNL